MDNWTSLPCGSESDFTEIGLMLAASPEFAAAFLDRLTRGLPSDQSRNGEPAEVTRTGIAA